MSFKVEFDKKDSQVVVAASLDEVARFILTKSNEHIMDDGVTNTGFLARSGEIRREGGEGSALILEYTAPYAAYVEFGTTPHKPPIEPLIYWVKRKLRIKDEEEAKMIAIKIRSKIGARGLKARKFLGKAIEEAVRWFS